MGTEVKTDDVGAVWLSWLGCRVVEGGGRRGGPAVVLLGNHCQDSSSFSTATSRCPYSDIAVVSENREECVVVLKLRDFLCIAGKVLEDGKGRLFCV